MNVVEPAWGNAISIVNHKSHQAHGAAILDDGSDE
jgi:hypothetical protein